MKLTYFIITLIMGLSMSACQNQQAESLPTLARLPSVTATLLISPSPSLTFTPSMTFTPTASPTISDTPSATLSTTPDNLLTQAVDSSLLPTIAGIVVLSTRVGTVVPTSPPMTRTPLPSAFSFGRSAQGRDLIAYRFGTGAKTLMLIGGIHMGFEANTVQTVEGLKNHFASHPRDILPDVTLIFVPMLNPDGGEYGRQLRGRFNGNNVDLNRNWGCDWSAQAVFRETTVNAGSQAFSESETQALGSLIQRIEPAAVLFYHAAANGVFAGHCNDTSVSQEMAMIYGIASGYPYGAGFGDYEITGSAAQWLDSIGIRAADIELASAELPEIDRNLRAVLALQQWLVIQP